MRSPAIAECMPSWPTISAHQQAARTADGRVGLRALSASASCFGAAPQARQQLLRARVGHAPRRLAAARAITRVRVSAWSIVLLASSSFFLRPGQHVAELAELGLDRAEHLPDLGRAPLQRQRAKAHLQAVQHGQQRRRPGQHDPVFALQRLDQAGPAQRLGIQALGRHEQDREVGGVRRRDVLLADRPRLERAAASRSPCRRPRRPRRRRAPARRAGARSPRAGTWRRSAATAARRRRAGPGSRIANSTRSLLPGTVATLVAYCSGVNTCSSSAASCTSPKMPRVFTLVSTRFSEPTSRASPCISPRPLCTCSSRSATCLKLSPSRCSSVACSFSSTVARICSSFFSLPSCSAVSRVSTACRTSARRRSLASDSSRSCSAEHRRSERAAARPRVCCCVRAPSWRRNESICSFCVRATSPLCVSSTCCKRTEVGARGLRLAADLVAQFALQAFDRLLRTVAARAEPATTAAPGSAAQQRGNGPVGHGAIVSGAARALHGQVAAPRGRRR